jgi:hypothetical protein
MLYSQFHFISPTPLVKFCNVLWSLCLGRGWRIGLGALNFGVGDLGEFQVSALGLGCMGLSAMYGKPVDDKDGVAAIHQAFENGVTFFDTSDTYGPHTNEKLLRLVHNFPLRCGEPECTVHASSSDCSSSSPHVSSDTSFPSGIQDSAS